MIKYIHMKICVCTLLVINSKRKTVQSTTSGIVYVCCNKVYIIGIGKICRACTMVYNRFAQMVIKDFAK